MKHFYLRSTLLIATVMLTAGFSKLMAQREVAVATGAILSDVIHGDTTDTGDRVDDNTIYVLERSGSYQVAKSLALSVPLQIKTADGDGFPASILPQPNSSGSYPQLIKTNGDVYLENVYITNFNGEGAQPKWGGFRVQGENSTVTLIGCWVEWDKASAIQVRANGISITIDGCRVAKTGDHMARNGNGRLVDCREFNVAKIEVTNTTMYHFADRIIRNMQGGKLDSLIFDHNTGAQLQGFHGTFHLGHVGYAQITNNLILNPKYMGSHTNVSEQTGPSPDNEKHYLVTADTIYDDTEFVIHHNNFVHEQKVLDFFDKYDTVSKPEVLAPIIATAMGADAVNAAFEEVIAFTSMPDLNMDYLDQLFSQPELDPTLENFPDEIGIANIDASYPETSASATGDEDGNPLGSSEWMDPTDPVEPPSAIRNSQINSIEVTAYPVPAIDYIQFSYTSKKVSDVTISLVDLTGKTVESLTQLSVQGTQNINISINELPAGLYFYSVTTIDGNASGKFTIIK